MKLKEFAKHINKTVRGAGKCNPEIEFYYGKTRLEVKRIGQWGVVPDVDVELMRWKPDDEAPQ